HRRFLSGRPSRISSVDVVRLPLEEREKRSARLELSVVNRTAKTNVIAVPRLSQRVTIAQVDDRRASVGLSSSVYSRVSSSICNECPRWLAQIERAANTTAAPKLHIASCSENTDDTLR